MARKVLDTGDLMRLLRATVIGARVDGRIRGRIYLCSPISDSRSNDALATQGGVHIPCQKCRVGFLGNSSGRAEFL
jgi:hypothetical protein